MKIRGSTTVFGILGHPVEHSLSPALHNPGFEMAGYDGVYIPLDIDSTGPFLKRSLQHMNLGGLSVTIPHKIWAYKMADTSDSLSQICGASNTLLFHRKPGGVIIEARNSDGPGAIQALKEVTSIRKKSVVICGYGGSARAIAAQLLLSEQPAELWITGRNPARIKSFIRQLKKRFPAATLKSLPTNAYSLPQMNSKNQESRLRKPDILIQTTPLGMSSHGKKGQREEELPLHPDLISSQTIVFDIVYNPMVTPLLEVARKKKCKIVYGYKMLLYQAVFQFRWFTGKEPPVQKWDALLRKDLKTKSKGR